MLKLGRDVPLKKILANVVLLVLIVCGAGYVQLANSIYNPFMIDGSMTLTESYASQFV